MGDIRNFEDLRVWQESRKLTRNIRAICKRHGVRSDFSFVDQITRSCRSIGANIAEGNDAMTIPEYIHYLGIAKRSAAEVRSHLYDALDEEHIGTMEFHELQDHARKIASMLAKLIHHLQTLNVGYKRTFNNHE
jgi:four helix bundle protein